MEYETKLETLDFKPIDSDPFNVRIEVLKDLDHAIDQVCDEIEKEGGTADPTAEDKCPYFGQLWPAGLALSEHMARMGLWLKGKSVLEVGCGLALPSIVCAKLGADVLSTDFHPDVEKFFSKNSKSNEPFSGKLRYQRINWNEPQKLGAFDFVIGSDILYERSHPENVAKTLASHCHSGSHIVLADPGRSYIQKCVDQIAGLGFRYDMFVRKTSAKEVFVFVFQKI